MPDVTANLAMPYILPAQAQKHVTHNEALQILDVLVQSGVQDRTRTSPPPAPTEGQCHLVATGATGAWAGQDGRLAAYVNGGWLFLDPRPGWQLWVLDEGQDLVFTTTGWLASADRVLQTAGLGVNAASDPVNRLTVASEATLLNNVGAGHQLKINKATATDTASLLFQTAFSGRAEMGLAGNDDFSLKVSPDGSTFAEALRINRTTGQITGAAVTQTPTDTTSGRLLAVGAGHQQLDSSLYRRGNVVGTASQTGGTPTGALIERGTNANGDYVRFADGTQMCWGQIGITPVANVATSGPWTFPASFLSGSTPSIVLSANSSVPGTTLQQISFTSPTTTGCEAVIYRTNSTTTQLRLLAIGRWF
ncbi:MAG: DUF2793 domain-containing protein [Paracoccaceae bacterium]